MRRVPVACCALLLLSLGRSARGDVAMECARAAERAQTLRDAAKFVEAREQLLVCVRDECPRAVVHDCVGWMRDVEQNVPTVVFGARDERGSDVTDVRVAVDGVVRASRLDGTSIPLDPGEHAFRFERGGAPPLEVRALVHEGEKNRLVSVQWTSPAPAAAEGAAAAGPSAADGHRRSVWPWLLGGAGVVAAGVATWGIASGLSDKSTLQGTCGATAQGCSDAQIDSARTKLWIGDVAAGVAVVALAASAVLLLSDLDRVDVAWAPGGGCVGVTHAF